MEQACGREPYINSLQWHLFDLRRPSKYAGFQTEGGGGALGFPTPSQNFSPLEI